MPTDRAEVLRTIVERDYLAQDHPALLHQAAQWRRARPLDGMRILDATPVFPNTLAKYVPLLTAGADLSVFLSPALPHDPGAVALLRDAGVPVLDSADDCDIALDCAGALADVASRTGYVELTKSGERHYQSCREPVFLADDSRIKLIETTLGTGDGFVRGMAHFGHPDLTGRSVVVFGCGKVGRGAALKARDAGAVVSIVDTDPHARPPRGSTFIHADDEPLVRTRLSDAWCVVSATGVPGALTPFAATLAGSVAILANLGAEDEFGPDIPAERVLNDKAPVNFALTEPTHLRYLDATFALHNACALALVSGSHPPGVNRPPTEVEDEILAIVGAQSAIAGEVRFLEEDLWPVDS